MPRRKRVPNAQLERSPGPGSSPAHPDTKRTGAVPAVALRAPQPEQTEPAAAPREQETGLPRLMLEALEVSYDVGSVLDRAGIGCGRLETTALAILLSRMWIRDGIGPEHARYLFGCAWRTVLAWREHQAARELDACVRGRRDN